MPSERLKTNAITVATRIRIFISPKIDTQKFFRKWKWEAIAGLGLSGFVRANGNKNAGNEPHSDRLARRTATGSDCDQSRFVCKSHPEDGRLDCWR
jgi:hypothetical protein